MQTRRRLVVASGLVLAGCSARGTHPSSGDVVSNGSVAAAEWTMAPSPALEPLLISGSDVAGLRSLLVVRDGVLIGERYYRGAAASDLLPINSVTKSISSMLVGLAVERGTLALDAPLERLLPEAVAQVPETQLADVTLEQILSGRSGSAFDTFKATELVNASDPVRLALRLPRTQPPGTGWSYNDPVIGLLSPMLARAEGRDLGAIAVRDLFTPLGIERFAWRRDRQGQPLSYAGLALRTRDLAKLAWTMADGGAWRGKQVLPEQWVARSTTPHGPADWRLPPITNIGYGCLWFSGSLNGRDVVWGWGYGGQFGLWLQQLRLTVATAATSPPREQLAAQTNAIMALVARIVDAAAAARS